jgi:hypothetical protein
MTLRAMELAPARLNVMIGVLKKQLQTGRQMVERSARPSRATRNGVMTSTCRSAWSRSGEGPTGLGHVLVFLNLKENDIPK